MNLLTKPLREMTPEERRKAIAERDKLDAAIRAENAKYKPAIGLPTVISDDLGINGVFCHADGKTYSSKSAYYKAVKAQGYEIVGNEKLSPKKPQMREIDWKSAVHEAMQRTGYHG